MELRSRLLYTNIQSSLLVYLLPFCLEAWREDVKGNYCYGGFVEHLYPVLANRKIFDEHLSPKQAAVVSDYMKETILEEIDDSAASRIKAQMPNRTAGFTHRQLMECCARM